MTHPHTAGGPSASSAEESYEAPRLTVLGHLADLTLQGPAGGTDEVEYDGMYLPSQ